MLAATCKHSTMTVTVAIIVSVFQCPAGTRDTSRASTLNRSDRSRKHLPRRYVSNESDEDDLTLPQNASRERLGLL